MDKAVIAAGLEQSFHKKEHMKQYIRQLNKEQLISLLISQIRGPQEITIPLSIFSRRLSSLEAIVKYLRENKKFSNKKTALLLLRSPQNTWLTYQNAKKKHPAMLNIRQSSHDLPISIFENSRLSILEIIVKKLKNTFTDREIANIIKRDIKTVATVLYRAKKKMKE